MQIVFLCFLGHQDVQDRNIDSCSDIKCHDNQALIKLGRARTKGGVHEQLDARDLEYPKQAWVALARNPFRLVTIWYNKFEL